MVSTTVWVILIASGTIIAGFVWYFLMPNRSQRGYKIKNAIRRPRGIIHDPRFGYAEILGWEKMGPDKVMLELGNGAKQVYYQGTVQPGDVWQTMAGQDAPLYVYNPQMEAEIHGIKTIKTNHEHETRLQRETSENSRREQEYADTIRRTIEWIKEARPREQNDNNPR